MPPSTNHHHSPLLTLLLLLLLGTVPVRLQSQTPPRLRLTCIITRHGARSPTNPFPNDLHKDDWPQGDGMLTTLGMQQMYQLGQRIRGEFNTALNKTYITSEVYVRSSNYDRTLDSGQTLLAGLYPPSPSQQFTPDLLWQPIPVHTVAPETDIMLDMDSPVCPYYQQLKEETVNSESYQERNASYTEYYEFLQNKSGLTKAFDPVAVWDVYDALHAAEVHNMSVPDWFTKEQGLFMADTFVTWQLDVNFGGFEKGRLKGGPLLRDIFLNMNRTINGTLDPPNRKTFIYSGHDNNIAVILKIFQSFNERYVPYASSLTLDLYEQNGFYVQMTLRNSSDWSEKYIINITACGGKSMCPFEEFLTLSEPFFITDEEWYQVCYGIQHANSDSGVITALAISTAVVVMIICGIIVYISMDKRKGSRDETAALLVSPK